MLNDPERAYVDTVCWACPELSTVHMLAADFQRIRHNPNVNVLRPCLEAAKASELHPLALGLERDRDAVLASICFEWSNGQVEDQVNRLKLVKRSMYVRAGFEPLRRRVLAA
jgi:transposase